MISLVFVFAPTNVNRKTKALNPTLTAEDVYTSYMANNSYKYLDILEESKEILSYYNNLKTRQDKIIQLSNDIKTTYENK